MRTIHRTYLVHTSIYYLTFFHIISCILFFLTWAKYSEDIPPGSLLFIGKRKRNIEGAPIGAPQPPTRPAHPIVQDIREFFRTFKKINFALNDGIRNESGENTTELLQCKHDAATFVRECDHC